MAKADVASYTKILASIVTSSYMYITVKIVYVKIGMEWLTHNNIAYLLRYWSLQFSTGHVKPLSHGWGEGYPYMEKGHPNAGTKITLPLLFHYLE